MLMLGSFVAEVRALDVVEEYYVEGPQFEMSLELFLRNLYAFIVFIHDQSPHLIEGVYTGARRWSVGEVKVRPTRVKKRAAEGGGVVLVGGYLSDSWASAIAATRAHRNHHHHANVARATELNLCRTSRW